MEEVSLSKALKIKNRQAKSVADLRKRIEQYNSVPEGTRRPFDISETYAELLQATNRLIATKTAISDANGPIQAHIYRMAELRGLAQFLRNLNVMDGPVNNYGMGAPTVYQAEFDAAKIQEFVKELEDEADRLQDAVDAHNASVRIQVEDA